MDTAVVLFTRDLRIGDNPALAAAAAEADHVVPLFVLDEAILGSTYAAPNRVAFLLDALADLRRSLRDLGADLVLRRGDPVGEAVRMTTETGAGAVHLAADVTGHARRREERLAAACAERRVALEIHPGPTVMEPGAVTPTSGDHYKVFTPYWKAWRAAPWRAPAPTPRSLTLPAPLDGAVGSLPDLGDLVDGAPSPDLAEGGETVARARMNRWTRSTLARYEDIHDDLPGDETSRISPYLHLGCLSALELATRLGDREGGTAFVRQLCWRDFHHQVTSAFPAVATEEYRGHGDDWRGDGEDFEAWTDGLTGYPIVDAGMRQLRREGWMHNRARMVCASFLTKDLYIDWRLGAEHFLYWLVDGDIANNSGNWQWTAGTGNDTRPNRVFNPLRQAERFDPDGAYVRRYVPELATVEGAAVHRPWDLGDLERSGLDYPERIVDHDEAARAFRERRG
jgi:deoxyribodipyrimidine photo-lyase